MNRIEVIKKSVIPARLLRGAEVLGRLFRSGVRCLGQWSGACPCSPPGDFCEAKRRWLGLVLEYHNGRYPHDLVGTEDLLVLECMNARQFEASGLTISLAIPGVRAPIKIGRFGTVGRTILDLAAIPEGIERDEAIEAVIKIQEMK